MADIAMMAKKVVGRETLRGEAALRIVPEEPAAVPVFEVEELEGEVTLADEEVPVFETVVPKPELLVEVLPDAEVALVDELPDAVPELEDDLEPEALAVDEVDEALPLLLLEAGAAMENWLESTKTWLMFDTLTNSRL